MGYQEKTSWATLIITALVLINYVNKILTIEVTDLSVLTLLSITFIWIIAATVIAQIILAILNIKEAEKGPDERDKLFELTAIRNASWVLHIFVFISFSQLIFPLHLNNKIAVDFTLLSDVSAVYNMANILIIGLLLSGITQEITKLIYYRRGY
ncbi:hypothetical protein [Thalassotalea piscium]|uniref:Magnesium-transporting ATPase (P-type) n=1 Tax=Thalassotalea piscium TaxID=1230533 RepID=A0A7X0NIE5_9GAMM|nr:hypothetical protein [Thalassotalea piscium]MBB6543953.1 magnesium-transporting ATPase (P-type) [Thalassotalea piscium]